jgi:putative methionine-R-sulfoxide reductase with GAF domain
VVGDPSNQFRGGKFSHDESSRDFTAQAFSRLSCNLPGQNSRTSDDDAALRQLKDLVASGNRPLEVMLATLADAACRLTGASGAAIAMWKDGAMICRARSGGTAPPIGARLSAESGISGECLRSNEVQNCADTETHPLVDVEVCRSLGLRSIAVLPIEGWRGASGILEVFSPEPSAFNDHDVAILRQISALAGRARAAKPHSASSVVNPPAFVLEQRRSSAFLPASDRMWDLASAFFGTRSRPLLFGIGALAISMVMFSMWLGWQGARVMEHRTHAAPSSAGSTTPSSATHGDDGSQSSIPSATVPAVVLGTSPSTHQAVDQNSKIKNVANHLHGNNLRDNDPVWNLNPGGEPLFISNGKPSPATPLKFAAKIDRIPSKKAVSKAPQKSAPPSHPLSTPSESSPE